MTSEIVILITELRNKQRITLPAGSYRFGRSAQCEYVLRRNNVGDHQFTVSFANGQWGVTDGGSDYRTWYNNRYLEPGETSILQSGDVVGLNTDGDADTQEITFRVEEITSVQGDGMAPKKGADHRRRPARDRHPPQAPRTHRARRRLRHQARQ